MGESDIRGPPCQMLCHPGLRCAPPGFDCGEVAAMTPNAFRRLALSLPDAIEGSHMGHADFRVGGKVFATIGYPDARYAMVKLSPEQQAKLVADAPEMF